MTGGVALRLLAGSAAGGVRIEVADTGPGIDDAARDRLFQVFERLNAAPAVEGAGLGLAIAARIVGLMAGTIGHTPNPAGGSVFWLDLPSGVGQAGGREAAVGEAGVGEAGGEPGVSEAAVGDAGVGEAGVGEAGGRALGADAMNPGPATTVADEMPAAAVRPASGRRVLLVDDMAMNRDIIGAFLDADGHTVSLAEGGQAAVRLAAGQVFDLILMDVRMPEMDGLAATRLIRALPAPHGSVPILALTACAFREQVEQCRLAGMDGHIAKPVDFATLARVIGETMAGVPRRWREARHAAPGPGLQVGAAPRPMLDRAVLDQTLAYLTADEAAAHLRSLRERNEQMLLLLAQPADSDVIAEAVHQLASAAGMFGFAAQEAAARGLEHAVIHGAPGVAGWGQRVGEETRLALTALDQVMREVRLQPA